MIDRAIWYSIDVDLKARKRHAVGIAEALDLFHRSVDAAGLSYESGEEALAATTVSFSRSNEEFIETCAHGSDQISVRIELPVFGTPWLLLPLRGTFEYEETARSVEAVDDRLREFFAHPPEELIGRLRPGRARRTSAIGLMCLGLLLLAVTVLGSLRARTAGLLWGLLRFGLVVGPLWLLACWWNGRNRACCGRCKAVLYDESLRSAGHCQRCGSPLGS